MTSVVAGIGWHVIGAGMAASFYAPIEKVKQWSWETTWALAGLFSWILLPISVSLFLLPDFGGFYAAMDASLLLKVALFGAMWGVGNVSYGLTMRYLGMSLGIGVAIGVTLIVGTLVPPVMHGQTAMLFTTTSGLLTMAGVLVALVGVAVVSWAGHQKEMLLKGASAAGEAREFNVALGLGLAVLCGIFSSGMSFAIDAAKPMETAALGLGVNPLYAALPSYVVIMGGGGENGRPLRGGVDRNARTVTACGATARRPLRGGVDRNHQIRRLTGIAMVAPCAGAWIETTLRGMLVSPARCRPLRGGVDRNGSDASPSTTAATSPPARGVDRNLIPQVARRRTSSRPLRGGVDRNWFDLFPCDRDFQSPPARGRGSKPGRRSAVAGGALSPPARGRGSKHGDRADRRRHRPSPPARGRGSKPPACARTPRASSSPPARGRGSKHG